MLHPRFSALLRSLRSLSFSSPPSSSPCISWKSTGKAQRTLASEVALSGTALHSGARTTARLLPAMAGEGRYFLCAGGGGDPNARIPAVVDHVVETPLCTTLCKDGTVVRTVEHLLSALEASGVDNCRIEIEGGDEVPILDGSSREWMELVERAGLSTAKDCNDNVIDKMAAFLLRPVYLHKNDSFLAAFPSSKIQITYGIQYQQVPAIGCQWFSCFPMDEGVYSREIASSRTFCIFEEVNKLLSIGLIQGGSLENAIVCSAKQGWLNPPLRFHDEPCRHKVLDIVGDMSLLAKAGNQGLPVAHLVAYKGGHSLHAELIRCILNHDIDQSSSKFHQATCNSG